MRYWLKQIDRLVVAMGRMARQPGQYPAAFSTLQSVSDSGLEATDQVRTMTIPWDAVKRITASMGHQQFDSTPTLLVDHEVGRSIFLYEGEELWTPFLDAVSIHLPQALPSADWSQRLSDSSDNPDAAIRVYLRPGQVF